MLLIDGVRYELWNPKTEDEFELIVKDHTQEIFGEQSFYFDRKQKLKSLSGIGSIPDGYALILGDSPHWHIVEIELSSHPLDQHIVSQVSRFISGIRNPSTQREIAGAIYDEITVDAFLELRLRQGTQCKDIYKFLADIISKPPVLTIIIEKNTEGLKEAIDTLNHPQIKVVEFRTFCREGIGLPVHAHLFEPLETEFKPEPRMAFLQELRTRFSQKKPDAKTSEIFNNYCYIPIHGKRIHLEWLFWDDAALGVELHIETKSAEDNLYLLKRLESLKTELETKTGKPLIFDRVWHGKQRWSRVYTLKEQPELTDELKIWAVETMIKFYEVFKPLVDEIDVK